MRDALPDPYPLPLELAEYLSHLGECTAASGARVSPDCVLPRTGGAGVAGTAAPVGSWSCMHQPLFHSLRLAELSHAPEAKFYGYNMAPFTNRDRRSTRPGASFHTHVLESRQRTISGYRPIVGPSEQARFQVFPELLAAYCGVVTTLEYSRRTASVSSPRASFSRAWLCQAQEVVAVPIDFTDGRRESGYKFQAANKLPPSAIQAGRLFLYQRLTPVELTYSGLAADANWAYERSSAWVKLRFDECPYIKSMMHFWVACHGYAITFRQPAAH